MHCWRSGGSIIIILGNMWVVGSGSYQGSRPKGLKWCTNPAAGTWCFRARNNWSHHKLKRSNSNCFWELCWKYLLRKQIMKNIGNYPLPQHCLGKLRRDSVSAESISPQANGAPPESRLRSMFPVWSVLKGLFGYKTFISNMNWKSGRKNAFLPNLSRVCGFIITRTCAIWSLHIEMTPRALF